MVSDIAIGLVARGLVGRGIAVQSCEAAPAGKGGGVGPVWPGASHHYSFRRNPVVDNTARVRMTAFPLESERFGESGEKIQAGA
jgi:hypothetical protein